MKKPEIVETYRAFKVKHERQGSLLVHPRRL